MRISAVLACHDEQRFLQAWLEATCDYADEILIGLHRPTDATPDIVQRFKPHSPIPIQCESFPADTVWRYGFSLIKNEMIRSARGDWITSIDADEEIGLNRDQLREHLALADQTSRLAVGLTFATLPRGCWRSGLSPPENRSGRDELRAQHVPYEPLQPKLKIFRNHAGIWWQGWIHEELYRFGRSASEWALPSEGLLHHYAYLNDQPPEWKDPLYCYLLCRIRDSPYLRAGTHKAWYEQRFLDNESSIRAAAAQFEAHRHRWFPST